jgi:hypothetical protein
MLRIPDAPKVAYGKNDNLKNLVLGIIVDVSIRQYP